MTAPVEIDRSKHTPEARETMSRGCKDERFARRLRGIAMILRGASREEAARGQDVDIQTVRDWVIRFNEAGPDGLRDLRRGGGTCRLNEEQRAELTEIMEAGPSVKRDGVCRWRIRDLKDWLLNRFGVPYTPDASTHATTERLPWVVGQSLSKTSSNILENKSIALRSSAIFID